MSIKTEIEINKAIQQLLTEVKPLYLMVKWMLLSGLNQKIYVFPQKQLNKKFNNKIVKLAHSRKLLVKQSKKYRLSQWFVLWCQKNQDIMNMINTTHSRSPVSLSKIIMNKYGDDVERFEI